jgi:hypothetical protein
MPRQSAPINPGDFTPSKVYRPLARRLDEAGSLGVTLLHIDRYSLDSDEGIVSQVGRSTRLHGQDDDVRCYLQIPHAAFDAGGRTGNNGIVPLRLRDVHPSIASDDRMGAIVRRGRTLFGRLETSSTKAQIYRPDGEDENGYTVFLLALMNYLSGSLQEIRWADDIRRAGRESANWSRIIRRASELGLVLTFGTKSYDPQNEKLLMNLLGGMSEQDDITRRKSLGGGRIEKLLENGCPISERQLPHGVRHTRGPDGRVLHDKILKFTAEADLALHPVIVQALRLHAAGTSYVEIGRQVLVPHAVPRRGQSVRPGATFADLAGDPHALSDAAKNFFVVGHRTAEDEHHLYFSKLTLWQTGCYPYRVDNDLRQRGVAVGGLIPTYRGPDDVTGYFDLVLRWDCPVTGFDSEDERDATIAKCRERLLRERAAPRTAAGRPPTVADRRAVSQFGRWTATDTGDERWPDDITDYGITTRRQNAGRDTFIIVHYPRSAATAADGRLKGLCSFAAKPQQHVAGTFASAALCESVATQIRRAVEDHLLDPTAVGPLDVQLCQSSERANLRAAEEKLQRRIEAALARRDQALTEANGLRTAAGLQAAAGDLAQFQQYDAQAREKDTLAAAEQADLERHEQQAAELARQAEPAARETEAELNALAYLQVGLARAAAHNGRAGHELGALVDQSLGHWRFSVLGNRVHWSCQLLLPLVDGTTAVLPLTGQVDNLRERTTVAAARRDILARQVLAENSDLDSAAEVHGIARKTLLSQRLMPWLVEHGITSRGLKNALVDHPLGLVRRVLHEHVTGGPDDGVRVWGSPLRQLLIDTYTGGMPWGDAACPDDTTWIATAVASVTRTTDLRKYGLPVVDLALQLGVSEDSIRELVKPQARGHGFRRPQFLRYADKAKTRVKAIGCPHGRCQGRHHADHVALLPEVAASGFGVICSSCRRAPNASDQWSRLQYPLEYLGHFTRRGLNGSLRHARQTVFAPTPVALAVQRQLPDGRFVA